MSRPPRSWLYVPGHRTERVAKALDSRAEAVVLDLEDAVPPQQKDSARAAVVATLADRNYGGPALWVRCNAFPSPWAEADLDALAGLDVDGIRVPRAEDPATVRQIAERTGKPLQLILESARGLARAENLATAHPQVAGIGLGEADLSADLRVPSDSGLDWARGWVVVVARAAGLPSPVQSVWTDVGDLEGLRASCERGRAGGFVGRSVVHPKQIPVVHAVFTPSAEEVDSARAVVAAANKAAANGEAAVLDDAGRFIDPAVVARAQVVLDLADEPVPTTHGHPGGDR